MQKNKFVCLNLIMWYTNWDNMLTNCFLLQDDGIMNREIDGDVAINLSTSQRPSAATTPNDVADTDENDQVSS